MEIDNVWPETWVLPFRIHTLGTPNRHLPIDKAVDTPPTLKKRMEEDGRGNFSYVLPILGTQAFVPMPIADFDWEVIVRELAEKET
jgi:hypothetical protein